MALQNVLEDKILFLKFHGIPDFFIKEKLLFSKEEIERAFQNLETYDFINKDRLITERGINAMGRSWSD